MSDLLTIGSTGISAYQRALATVSNNIANVNTEGYARQDVSLVSNQPRLLGGSYLGTGARFDSVRRQYDAFVESNLRNSQSELKRAISCAMPTAWPPASSNWLRSSSCWTTRPSNRSKPMWGKSTPSPASWPKSTSS